MNKHWPRWIFASVSKHFDDRRQSVVLYIDGQQVTSANAVLDSLELIMDGPNFTEISKNYWLIETKIHLIVKSRLSESNYHAFQTSIGVALVAFTKSIEVLKLGVSTEAENTGLQLGCLHLVSDANGRQPVQVVNFGLVDKSAGIYEAMVVADYRMELFT